MDTVTSPAKDIRVQREFDAIVVGVGAMGSSACYHLASRGQRVLGIDRFSVPNAMGSSHGLSRMIRMAYYEHPNYVPLLRRASELWENLEQTSGEKLLHKTGGLYMGRPDDPAIKGALQSAHKHGLSYELLDPVELTRRFPQFRVSDESVGLLEQNAGFLVPEKCIAQHANLAQKHGTEIHANEAVLDWCDDNTGVTVRTDRDEYRAGRLVFTAGAWTGKLLANLAAKLLVTRQVMAWVRPKKPEQFAIDKLPVWAIGQEDGTLLYGFPMLSGDQAMKLAWHRPGTPTDPDAIERTANDADEREIRDGLREFIPDADGPLAEMRVCMYTNSPDHHFIIDRHPAYRRITLACGFSGHGFKFSSVVGEIVADLVTTGTTELPAEFLKMQRFGADRGMGL